MNMFNIPLPEACSNYRVTGLVLMLMVVARVIMVTVIVGVMLMVTIIVMVADVIGAC